MRTTCQCLPLAAGQSHGHDALRLRQLADRREERQLTVRLERPLSELRPLIDDPGDVVRCAADHVVVRATDVAEAVDRQVEHARARVTWGDHERKHAERHPVAAVRIDDHAGRLHENAVVRQRLVDHDGSADGMPPNRESRERRRP